MNIRDSFSLKNALLYLLTGLALVVLTAAMNMTYPGKIILPLLKAGFLAMVIFIYGFFFMSFTGKYRKNEKNQASPDAPTAFAVGLIFTCFFFFLAGFFKLLILPVMLFYYLLPLALLVIILKRQKVEITQTIRTFFDRSPLAWPVFLLPLVFAVLPPSFYDTLVYHLGIPNFYLQHGGFIETPQFLFANTSIYYEVSLIPAVFAGDLTPRLFHFLIGAILLLTAADFAKETFDLKKRHFFILITMAMPMSVFLLSTVKNDLAGAFFILLGMRYLLKDRFSLSALFWGFAVGIKYINVLPLVIFVVIILIKNKSFPVKKLTSFAIICAATLAPLLLKNYIYAGNPFFPFFGIIFPSEFWDHSRFSLMQSDVGKMFHSFKDALRFPYTVSFRQTGFGGMVGVQFLAFLPFLLLVKDRLKHKAYLLVFALLTIYAGGLFTGSVRFLYIAFLVLTFYLALIYESLDGSLIQKTVKVLLLLVVSFNLVLGLSLNEHMNRSFRMLSGTMELETYKSSMFPTYPAFAYVNEHVKKLEKKPVKVLLVGEARNYYLKHPYVVASGVDYSILRRYLKQSRTIADFLRVLKEDNIGVIIFNAAEFNRLQQGYQRMTETELRHMTLFFQQMQDHIVFNRGNLVVFSILSIPPADMEP